MIKPTFFVFIFLFLSFIQAQNSEDATSIAGPSSAVPDGASVDDATSIAGPSSAVPDHSGARVDSSSDDDNASSDWDSSVPMQDSSDSSVDSSFGGSANDEFSSHEELHCGNGMSDDQVITSLLGQNRYVHIPRQNAVQIGKGGFGTVHKVFVRRCTFVVKCLNLMALFTPGVSLDNDFDRIEQFAGRYVAKVYAKFRTNLGPGECFGMPLYNGDIYGKAYKRKNYSTEKRIQMSLHGLSVIEQFHDEGLLGSDIKPENVLLNASDDDIVLTDFGAVKGEENITAWTPKNSGFEIQKDRAHDVVGFTHVLLGLFGYKIKAPKRRHCISNRKTRYKCLTQATTILERGATFVASKYKPRTPSYRRLPPAVKQLVDDSLHAHPAGRPWVPEIKQRLTAFLEGVADPFQDARPRSTLKAPSCRRLSQFIAENPPSFYDLMFGLFEGGLRGFPGHMYKGKVYGCPIYIFSTLREINVAEFAQQAVPVLRTLRRFTSPKRLKYLNYFLKMQANSKFDRQYTIALYQKA